MTTDAAPDIDFDALAQKYVEERAKRLRDDNIGQWIQLKAFSADLARDPRADPDFSRAPIREDVEALVIGGGFGGLLAAARLREQGIEKLRIVEIGADFGGTWYWNHYPGIACDIESYIYMPLLEELGVMPSEKYAKGAEIFEHCRRIARHFDLYSGALFQTAVETAQWDEARQRWTVTTSRGDELSARFVVSCTGFICSPKMPNIPGAESFQGRYFHTCRWDYDYTGGDQRGNMTGLRDKVVGIIGTGATSVQVVPHLGQSAKHLYVFQRTPMSVDVRGNRPTDEAWVKTLEPGWARARRNNFTIYCAGGKTDQDLVDDGWTDIARHMRPSPDADPATVDPAELTKAGMRKMESTRRRVNSIVEDKATAEALKPYFHLFCKRPGFHDEYLQTFNRPNVTLVDTKGKGVERITANGVVANGKEFKLDCLIYATGFEWNPEYKQENGVEFVGRDGLTLSKYWQDGSRTLYGLQARNFPNLFFARQIQSGSSFNYGHSVEEQTKHIAFVIAKCREKGAASVEPTKEAEDNWVEAILAGAARMAPAAERCTPGYYNAEGRTVDRKAMQNTGFAGGPLAYFSLLEEARKDPELPDLLFHRPDSDR